MKLEERLIVAVDFDPEKHTDKTPNPKGSGYFYYLKNDKIE